MSTPGAPKNAAPNGPRNTFNLYENSEIISGHQTALRRGNIDDACFCVIERDLDKKGNAAWGTNFLFIGEEINMASPIACLTHLLVNNRWLGLMKKEFKGATGESYKNHDARELLISSTVDLARRKKTRISVNATIVSLVNDLTELTNIDPDEFDISNKPLISRAKWITELGPAQGKIVKTKYGLDIRKIMKLFLIFLDRTTEVWTELHEKSQDQHQPKGKEKATKTEPSTDNEIKSEQEEDDEIETTEETALDLEKNLLTLAHMIYAVDVLEQRKIPYRQPKFVHEVFSRGAIPDTWKNEFPKIMGKSENLFKRPIAWMFSILIEKAFQEIEKPGQEHKKFLILTLLCLLEMCARDLGNEHTNFINAILFVVRNQTLNWNITHIETQKIVEEAQVKKLLELYDAYPVEEPRDAQRLIKRRSMFVIDDYIDKNTFRGKGKNTLDILNAFVQRSGLDLSSWPEGEFEKSHGEGKDFYKNQSAGLPTAMFHFLNTVVRIDEKYKFHDDPYEKDAYTASMEQEEKYGTERAKPKYIFQRQYAEWVQGFPVKLPKPVEVDNVKPKTSRGKKTAKTQRKPKPAKARSKKTVIPEYQSGSESSEGDTTEILVLVKKNKHVDAYNAFRITAESEVQQIQALLPNPSQSDDASVKEPHKNSKKGTRNTTEKSRSKNQSTFTKKSNQHSSIITISESDSESESISSDEDSQEEEKRIRKLKQHMKKQANLSQSTPSQTFENKKKSNVSPPSTNKSAQNKRKFQDIEDLSSATNVKKKAKSTPEPTINMSDGDGEEKPIPAVVASLNPRQLDGQEKKDLYAAPLAQLPRNNGKKMIRVTPEKVYKGPYDVHNEKDMTTIGRIFCRIYRLKTQWKDCIILHHELVYDVEDGVVFLCAQNIGTNDPSEWVVEQKFLKTHSKKQVWVLQKQSMQIYQADKIIVNANFESFINAVVVDLAARYVAGVGDCHMGDILLGCDGKTLHAIDFDDNRDPEDMPTVEDTFRNNDQGNCELLIDCLFGKGKRPAKKDFDKFCALLPSTFSALRYFIANVRTENTENVKDVALKLGYTEGPSKQEVEQRLKTLEICIASFGNMDQQLRMENIDVAANAVPSPALSNNMQEVANVM